MAVSESSAGGLISAALLAIPGASAYFLGGGVIYTQAARRGLLGVADSAMTGIRSSSEPYAQLKARRIRELLGATWGLSETGATGPTGNRYGDAAGHACMAVAGPVERVITLETGATTAKPTCGRSPAPRWSCSRPRCARSPAVVPGRLPAASGAP